MLTSGGALNIIRQQPSARWCHRSFERLVGEHETSSGELLGVQVKCAVLLERVPQELRTHFVAHM